MNFKKHLLLLVKFKVALVGVLTVMIFIGQPKIILTMAEEIVPSASQSTPSGALDFLKADFWSDTKDFFSEKKPELPFCSGDNADKCGLKQGLDRVKGLVQENNFTTTESLPELIISWTNYALGFLFVLAMTALIYSGFLWITDLGAGANKKTAISILTYVIIGVLIILVAYPIVRTILSATS